MRFDNVGQGLKSGEIFIEGDCGKCAGRGMSGGNLVVNGDSGPFAGSAMSGGRLEMGAIPEAFSRGRSKARWKARRAAC